MVLEDNPLTIIVRMLPCRMIWLVRPLFQRCWHKAFGVREFENDFCIHVVCQSPLASLFNIPDNLFFLFPFSFTVLGFLILRLYTIYGTTFLWCWCRCWLVKCSQAYGEYSCWSFLSGERLHLRLWELSRSAAFRSYTYEWLQCIYHGIAPPFAILQLVPCRRDGRIAVILVWLPVGVLLPILTLQSRWILKLWATRRCSGCLLLRCMILRCQVFGIRQISSNIQGHSSHSNCSRTRLIDDSSGTSNTVSKPQVKIFSLVGNMSRYTRSQGICFWRFTQCIQLRGLNLMIVELSRCFLGRCSAVFVFF